MIVQVGQFRMSIRETHQLCGFMESHKDTRTLFYRARPPIRSLRVGMMERNTVGTDILRTAHLLI